MDDDFQQLEAELKRLRPAALSGGLNDRVAEELAASLPQQRLREEIARTWWAWAVMPAAAAAVIFAIVAHRPAAKPEPAGSVATRTVPAAFKPVQAENLLLDAHDDGLVTFADGTPARRVRQSYVDTITWKNPRTHASLTWSLPREEVRIVPVNFQ